MFERRFMIRSKLQQSLQHVQIMQSQLYNATEYLARTYGLPHADVMQCAFSIAQPVPLPQAQAARDAH